MREIKLDKVVPNIGGVGEKLDRGVILLEKLSGKKAVRVAATKRIPTWHVRPGLEVGTKVTLRGEDAEKMITRLLPAIKNTLKDRQIRDNFVSFGIHEYIEVPGLEYIREVGIMGFEVTIVYVRAGKRTELRKVKHGKVRRQVVTAAEIEEILTTKYGTKVLRRGKKNDSE